MSCFQSGLVVGKFAPLHRGHELVIETARRRCERVLVLSYSRPELTGCEPARRRQWLAASFPDVRSLVLGELEASALGFALPHNDDPADDHRMFVARVCHEVLGVAVDAVFTSEDYGAPFAAALTAYQRKLNPHAPPVTHVSVDPLRERIPTSGTAIRAELHAQRHWLNPFVYASFVRRAVMLGPESSGKTSLARALGRVHETQHVEEYGRELWLERGGELDRADLLRIAREQTRREEQAIAHSHRVLFCDTSPLTTALYSRLLFGDVPDELECLAGRAYDLTVYCAPDFPFVQDGTRAGEAFRDQQDALTRAELERRNVPYLRVHGSLEQRIRQVSSALGLDHVP